MNNIFNKMTYKKASQIIEKVEQTIIVIAPVIISLTYIYAPTFEITAYVDGGVICTISLLEYAKLFLKAKI
jgi:hypothetical protein